MTAYEDQPAITYYADDKDWVTVSCPHCYFQKEFDASKYKNIKRALKIGCRCGNHFLANIEFRHCYRKKVNLAGNYFSPKNGERGEILVEDLSVTGVGFSTLEPHTLMNEDPISITFMLDNAAKSIIQKRAVVKSVQGKTIGVSFAAGQGKDPDLNFYLLP